MRPVIDFVTPVSPEANLGAAYNRVMRNIPPGGWACIRDCDTAFLVPMSDVLAHMYRYIKKYPKCGLFTCLTNRIYAREQLYKGHFSEATDLMAHIDIAEDLISHKHTAPETPSPISGFLMLVSREMWDRVGGFSERGRFLGIDNKFGEACRRKGSPPRVMKSIYVFHVYRMGKGRTYKKHLL